MRCWHCGYKNDKEHQFCQRKKQAICLANLYPDSFRIYVPKNPRKFSWLTHEKNWHADIKSRVRMPDGKVVRLSDSQFRDYKQKKAEGQL